VLSQDSDAYFHSATYDGGTKDKMTAKRLFAEESKARQTD
jgi:hypothetical protein